jgi:CheY-like chemotaxis protein
LRQSGVVVLDRVIGGLAPGLPLLLAGPSGCGRTVLTLELAAAALRDEGIVVLLTAEPASLLLRQAEALGIELAAFAEGVLAGRGGCELVREIATREDAPAGPAPGAPATILLVEDDAGLRAQLGGWLESRHRVVTASDGLNALSALLGERPDCIVLELGMARISGYEVLAALHRTAQAIPILVLTHSTRRASERVGPLVLGAADVLAKPVAAFELLHKVDLLLRLEGPPPRLMEPEDAMALFGSVSPSRVQAAPEFRDRLTRSCDFGTRFGAASTLVAVTAAAAGVVDSLIGVADHELRFEDAVLLVSKRRALLLLVAADPGCAPVVMERLIARLTAAGGDARSVRWRASEARPPREIGDWRSLFRELEVDAVPEREGAE